MKTIKCNVCGSIFSSDLNSSYVFCPEGHMVHQQRLTPKPDKSDNLGIGRVFYNININRASKRDDETGVIDKEGYHIFIDNARKGEIVDIEIKKVITEKGIAFADVIHYRKTVGKLDFNREFNCPKEVNASSYGGGNRKKCVSVIYPEERIPPKVNHKKSRVTGYKVISDD